MVGPNHVVNDLVDPVFPFVQGRKDEEARHPDGLEGKVCHLRHDRYTVRDHHFLYRRLWHAAMPQYEQGLEH